MVLFQIPDIRLFWTTDDRFLAQFRTGSITTFKPYSKYPRIVHDISFWLPLTPKEGRELHENDFCDTVRDVAGDLVENVKRVGVKVIFPLSLCQSICRSTIFHILEQDKKANVIGYITGR
jgi:phenylalanyl-tRNA synthetase alpha chain